MRFWCYSTVCVELFVYFCGFSASFLQTCKKKMNGPFPLTHFFLPAKAYFANFSTQAFENNAMVTAILEMYHRALEMRK